MLELKNSRYARYQKKKKPAYPKRISKVAKYKEVEDCSLCLRKLETKVKINITFVPHIVNIVM